MQLRAQQESRAVCAAVFLQSCCGVEMLQFKEVVSYSAFDPSAVLNASLI